MCHELVNGAWVARAPMRTARKDFAVAVVDESKIVVAGGKCHEVSASRVRHSSSIFEIDAHRIELSDYFAFGRGVQLDPRYLDDDHPSPFAEVQF